MTHAGIFRTFAGTLAGFVATLMLLVASPSQSAPITIDDGGLCASWTLNGSTLTCNAAAPAPAPAPGPGPAFACSFSPAAPGPATVGAGLSLTVNCSNGTGTGFAWSATAPSGCSGNCTASWGAGAQTPSGSNTLTLPAAGLWTITVTVTGPSVVTAQASVQANTAPAAGGTNLCAAQGFSKTIFYKWDWAGAQPSHLDTVYMVDMAGGSGLGTNGILVVEFTPNGPADFNNVSSISATGYPAPNLINYLTLAISTQPCDLGAPWPASSSSTSPTVAYGVGTVQKPWAGPKNSVELQPGARYYLNVAGRDQSGANTCIGLPGGWNCDIRLSPQKPPGH